MAAELKLDAIKDKFDKTDAEIKDKKEKSLKKNFAYNFLYQLLAIIVPLITSPYLARTLGAENIGIASWTNSIVFYFGMFIVLEAIFKLKTSSQILFFLLNFFF